MSPQANELGFTDETGNGPAKRRSAIGLLIEPVRYRIYAACFLQAVAAICGVVPFIAVAEIGRALLSSEGADPARIWWIAGAAVGSLGLRLFLQMAALLTTHFADVKLQLELRRRMAQRLSRVPLGWFDAHNSGAVKKALQDDVTAMHYLVGHAITDMVSAAITPLVVLAYLFWIDWSLALVALVPLSGGMVLYAVQFRGFGPQMAAYNRSLNDVNAAVVEFVRGIAVVKTFGRERQAYSRLTRRSQKFIGDFWAWLKSMLVLSAATEIVLSPLFSLAVVVAGGFLLIAAGLADPLDVLPAAVLAPALTAPLMALTYAANELMVSQPAAERVAALLEAPVLPTAAAPLEPQGARVEYRNVAFSYDGETVALKDIDLILEPGTVTALVGPSGSGKSTLARLLPRFWDVQSGQITLGGVPLQHMDPHALYARIGFVFQDVQLLRRSVAENIALGRPGASKEEIENAARAAQIHDRILTLPGRYEAVVGEDARFSGGEAQRISIARALLADAPILVLDEATAFADPESEAAIQDALSRLIAGRTLLVIAHRLHTITAADQICVLDKGRIVERGRHQALLDRGGLYTRLWNANEAALAGEAEHQP